MMWHHRVVRTFQDSPPQSHTLCCRVFPARSGLNVLVSVLQTCDEMPVLHGFSASGAFMAAAVSFPEEGKNGH